MQLMGVAQHNVAIPEHLVSYIKQESISNYAMVYQYTNNQLSNCIITTISGNRIDLPSTGSLYFIDEFPTANWSHPCRYVWFDSNLKKSKTIKENNPPSNLDKWVLISENYILPTKNHNRSTSNNKTPARNLSSSAAHNYAVIISGGYNAYNNHIRYWNDCQAIYSTLVNEYGYLDSHIYVLISDGTNPANDRNTGYGYDSSPLDLDGDGDNDIQYAATKNNITSVFNLLSNTLTSNDFLYIFTTDHGDTMGGDNALLCLWGETMTDAEFANEVNKVNAGAISIVMEQCYSGGFVSDLTASNRVIATACTAYEFSYAMTGLLYNEFVYHWTSAVRGCTPYGTSVNADTNNDGLVSMKEAFDYAKNNDSKNETPQYNSSTPLYGELLSLNGYTIYIENQTITSNTAAIGGKIEISNVTVQNNSSINAQALESTTINGPFEVKLGSTLDIK